MSKMGGKSSGDIEEGTHHSHQTQSDEDSLCFSDAEAHSWQSPYGSNGGGSTYDEGRVSAASCLEIDGSREHGRKSCVSESSLDDDDDDDTEMGASEVKVNIDKVERDCRICHLSLEKAASESGVTIVLGCSCKGDLAAAHKQCAETWFKIKGNKGFLLAIPSCTYCDFWWTPSSFSITFLKDIQIEKNMKRIHPMLEF
uniref:RING-CH-type domain-containing protein n=1 Tax=Musa acuminata subsp. malaccensis TaxID=214687 RepID=A0A804JVW5_MUSAM|nr:PREDICTED: uncharacterized protein LOC103991695 isoform X2 [Musa acuminata subsp. malaccensis]